MAVVVYFYREIRSFGPTEPHVNPIINDVMRFGTVTLNEVSYYIEPAVSNNNAGIQKLIIWIDQKLLGLFIVCRLS